MRKSTKLLSICCLCLFSFFLFAGCGTITYTYSTGLDGSIQENFTISLDSDALSNDGIDTLATMTKLDEIIDNWWTTTSSNLVEQDSVTFTNEPTNPTKRSITIKYASSEAYSQFYNNVKVLTEKDQNKKKGYLGLSSVVLEQIKLALNTLGIDTPNRM